jgi:signal transduction histidine kinase
LKRVEIEAFVKGFMLFFLSMGVLMAMVIYSTYTKEIKSLDERLLDKMRICSFDLQCEAFSIDFADKEKFITYKLYKQDGLKAYFPIPKSKNNLLLISLSQQKYKEEIKEIRWELFKEFILMMVVIVTLSILFSLYTLSPLRRSLRLTEEFIKDILHDFNTPLASLRLNSSMLKREIGENKKIIRMENNIENILSLQENLRCYLFDHEMQQEALVLRRFIETSVDMIQKSYPHISYRIEIPQHTTLQTNPKAFGRIIDNLLSNASKYNKPNGKVEIIYKNNKLIIADTGKGIKNTKKIFQRFYKEQERGIGVGLHIVKKLCDELNISIEVESKVGEGTIFTIEIPIS